jgi:uncharacterized membrane protein
MNRFAPPALAILTALAWILGLPLSHALSATTAASPEEAQQAAAAVFHLFEAKCNDCHGAHLEKPKGKFGYIMDFKRIAENEDMIAPGDPAKSEFFRLVNEDEMPGEKSDVPAATPAEKLALRRWIQLGAPTDLPKELEEKRVHLLEKKKDEKLAPAAAAADPKEPQAQSARIQRSFLSKLLSWIGRFHAASTHFPVGLLSIAVLSEILGWLTKRPSWLFCTRFLLVLGASSGVGTAVLGWLNDYSGASIVYSAHKWLGTATAVWGLISAGCAVLFECREGTLERQRLRVTVFLGALLVSVAGFLGGAVSFGLDHYRW